LTVAFYASEVHFADHLLPLYRALPPERQGPFIMPGEPVKGRYMHRSVVVAGYGDLKNSRRWFPMARRALLQHGSGQSYWGTTRGRGHPSYSGGADHYDVSLFLCPNEFSASKWRQVYPKANVAVVGSPKVSTLPTTAPAEPTVAVSFHWQCGLLEETKSAYPAFRLAYQTLAERWPVVGHAHPRAQRMVKPMALRAKVPWYEQFADVCAAASVYVCDNSSTLFEFAATGKPVVLLNAPGYRKDVDHGMRFWELATMGPQVDHIRDLAGAVEFALADPATQRAERERVVDLVYPVRAGSSELAAAAVQEWAR